MMRALVSRIGIALLACALAPACSCDDPIAGADLDASIPGSGADAGAGDSGLPGTPPSVQAGPGTTAPFDVNGSGSTGVNVDPSGNVVLDPANPGSSASLIWVANSDEGTISKVDTRLMNELARYRTGPDLPDPSRTTISLDGDVVVANRHRVESATKIAADPSRCSGQGTATSTGAQDVRAWRDDPCVLWHTPFPADSIPRAAAFDAEPGVEGALSSNVWIGLYGLMQMVKLDATTGAQLVAIDTSPVPPYGAAVDKFHNIWIVSNKDQAGKIHIPTGTWTQIKDPPCSYGISVDQKGRVWTCRQGCVARYTPETDTWDQAAVGNSNRGIAVDASGSVWFADTNFGVHRVDGETMQEIMAVDLAGQGFIGMAIDFDGMAWAISQDQSAAFKIDPVTYAVSSVPVGQGPYTYSDMTGFQLRNAAARFGKYRQTFSGCSRITHWTLLNWAVELSPTTSIEVQARTADSLTALASTPWVLVARQPPDSPPIDLVAKLGADADKTYLQVEFLLRSSDDSSTPILSRIDAWHGCSGGGMQ